MVRLQVGPKGTNPIRALCDTGSQINLISSEIIDTFKIPTKPCRIQVIGINGTYGEPYRQKVKVGLMSRNCDDIIANIEFIVAENWKMGPLPSHHISHHMVPTRQLRRMADPQFHTPNMVHMLLGAGALVGILQDSVVKNSGGFAIQDSTLGWLIYGGSLKQNEEATSALVEADADIRNLIKIVERFWQLDDLPVQKVRSREQEECERFFMSTHSRTDTGRYVVKMPICSETTHLGSSRQIAMRRFHALERRFDREPALRTAYVDGIQEMLRNGYLREVTRPATAWTYHIPHHAVLTKFRIVFDGSCRTDQGISINEIQMKGEKLQEDLIALILRFRLNRIGITADIKKMYLQVCIAEDQWDMQRIFWRERTTEQLKEYWLTRVTFGMAAAPHCAVRAMIQCARDHKKIDHRAAIAIEQDFYMDDCLTGADSEDEAVSLCRNMKDILAKGGFALEKWHSNRSKVLPNTGTIETTEVNLGDVGETTVLGLRWRAKEDELMFKFRPKEIRDQRFTKRDILAQTAEVFDPCGFVAPVIITAKIILRKLHQQKINWDSQIPEAIKQEWIEWQSQLSRLTMIRLPRWVGTTPTENHVLHGFADASESAYGAVIYLRLVQPKGAKCMLIAAKSRVAPVKTVTIPRLELCAAVLLSKLLQCVKQSCRWKEYKAILWSDSAIVLHWMRKDVDSLKPFVHNRIQNILAATEGCEWRHVSTVDNPADLLSRGIEAEALNKCSLWWEGPAWLQEDVSRWPTGIPELTTYVQEAVRAETRSCWMDRLTDQRLRPLQRCLVSTTRIQETLNRTSSLRRAVRRIAWIWRFLYNCRPELYPRQTGDVTEAEEERALITLVREEQRRYYKVELEALTQQREVPKSSQLWRIALQIDEQGILKLRGRLEHSLCPEGQKHPMILPDVSYLADLLIRQAHKETFHGGYQVMAATLRQRFWIMNLRRAIRTYISRCLPCVRQKQKVCEQIMGNLPADRVRQNPPFQRSGVDYAGPFEVKARGGRCNIFEKKYVAVFVCLTTKAVHLELVESLTTAAFIAAFLRFTSIRGSCTHLWSDNGTSFVGAEKEIGKMVNSWSDSESHSHRDLRELRVKWHFIAPSAPHQGGLWEAAVKSMKYHLKRVVGKCSLEGDHFRTLLAQISAIMNSRPLSALSEVSDDIDFLSPGHFLIGRPMKQLFGEQHVEPPRSALKRYEMTQHMSQSFWKQWHASYLNDLQQRSKWFSARDNLQQGDLVLIKEDNAAPTFWSTGRVVKILPGGDGFVRNVELRIAGKKRRLVRPVQKLVRLPLDRVEELDSSRGDCLNMAGIGRGMTHIHSQECGKQRTWSEKCWEYRCK